MTDMKRILLLLLFITLGISLPAQNVYVVNRTKGNVERFSPDKKSWIPAGRKDTLKLKNKVRIPNKGELVFVETGTGLVYTATEGSFSVKEIVDLQKKRRASLIRSVLGQVVDESRNKVQPRQRVAYGATKRGEDNGDFSGETSLVDTLLGESFPHLKVGFSEKEKDGTVFLTLENTSSDAIMVNVIGINRKEAVARVLLPTESDETLILPPGTTELPFIKVIPSPEVEYHVFPVFDGIDYSLLQRLLSEKLVD